MKIGAILNVNTFKGTQEASTATSPNEKKDIKEVVKDNKGKIALGLSALAAVGIAAVAITRGKKVPSELSIDDFKKIGKFDKGVATVKGQPFSGVIDVINEENKYALEYADGVLKSSTSSRVSDGKLFTKKVYSEKDGVKTIENFFYSSAPKYNEKGLKVGELGWLPDRRKTTITDGRIINEYKRGQATLQNVVERQQDGTWKKTFQEMDLVPDYSLKNKNYSRYYISTMDEAGNVIAKKPVYTRKPAFSSGETFIKRVEKYTDKDGNQVVETLKNGKPFARQTTKMADDGSKQIVVEYLDKGSKGYKKIIDIAKDGTRKESEIGHRFISL